LTLLSLKSPGTIPLTGTVIGIAGPYGNDTRVTIITNDLDLITLGITEDTTLTRLGTETGQNSPSVGDRIVSAAYDPITRELVHLESATPAP